MKQNGVLIRFGIGLGLLLSALSISFASDEPELTMAVRNQDVTQVQKLLSQGVDVEERDEGIQQTALMRAAQVGDDRIVQILLARHADINARDDAGNTALFYAVERGDTQLARILVSYGADPNMRNAQGNTALTLARKRGSHPLLSALKQQKDRNGKRVAQIAHR